MRIAVARRGVETDLAERVVDERPALGARAAEPVRVESLADDLLDRHARRQRAVRILEDDLHLSPERTQRPGSEALDLAPQEGDPPLAALQPQQRERERRLAGTALADDPERPTLTDGQAHPVHRLHVRDGAAEESGLDREPHLHVAPVERDGRVRGHGMRAALRLGGDQRARVVVARMLEDARRGPRVHDLAPGHHADAVAGLPHDAQVVGDQQQRHAEARLQILEEPEDLSLDGDVERRGRLVGDQQVRLVGQRHRDHHALPLAPRELVGIRAEALLGFRKVDEPQQLERAGPRGRPIERLVHGQHLAHLLAEGVQRVQRRHRLLEDHCDPVAADATEGPFGGADQLLAAEQDAAAGMPRLRVRQELQDRQRRHRLPGSALPDQRHRLAPVDVEGHAPDGGELAHGRVRAALGRVRAPLGRVERDGQAADAEERRRAQVVFRGSKASRTASPMNTRRLSITASTRKPVIPIQGAWRLAFP